MTKNSDTKYKIYRGFTVVIRWVMFAVVAFFILFPVYWIFISSITPPGELFKKPIDYLPDHPTLESYSFLIQNVGLLAKIGSTVIIIGVTLVVGTIICVMGAYGFARFRRFLSSRARWLRSRLWPSSRSITWIGKSLCTLGSAAFPMQTWATATLPPWRKLPIPHTGLRKPLRAWATGRLTRCREAWRTNWESRSG